MRIVASLALLALICLTVAQPASAQGMFPGYPAASSPLTGSETIPADTNLSGGANPQTELISTQLLGALRATAYNNLTSAATAPVNLKTTSLLKLTLGRSGGVAVPTNPVDGQVWSVLVAQDATGGYTLKWDSNAFKWTAGTVPTVTVTANRVTRLDFIYNATTGFHYGISTLNYF